MSVTRCLCPWTAGLCWMGRTLFPSESPHRNYVSRRFVISSPGHPFSTLLLHSSTWAVIMPPRKSNPYTGPHHLSPQSGTVVAMPWSAHPSSSCARWLGTRSLSNSTRCNCASPSFITYLLTNKWRISGTVYTAWRATCLHGWPGETYRSRHPGSRWSSPLAHHQCSHLYWSRSLSLPRAYIVRLVLTVCAKPIYWILIVTNYHHHFHE